MKILKSIAKSTFLAFLLFAFVAVMTTTSCQKEETQELATDLSDPSDLALEKLSLELIFSVSTDGLSDEQIAGQYDALMGLLSEEDRAALIQIVEQAMAQDYAPGNTNPALSFRATETLLSNGVAGDGFGQSVATVGNKVYVGATQVQKVFEYSKTGGSYTLTDEITPTGSSSRFGSRVSVSGSWMAVGAPGGGSCCAGNVFMFKKQGSSWVQKAILTGPAGETGFGGSLVLRDGKLAVTSLKSSGFNILGATISVFELGGNNWSLSEAIFQPGLFFSAIDMNEDENRIVCTGGATVRALIFAHNGSNWVLEDDVIVPPGALFPSDVVISYNTIVLTATIPGTKHWVIGNNGGDWEIEQELLIPPGGGFAPRFAAIQESTILIGAASNNNAIPEAVHVFNNAGGSWDLSETLTPSDNGENVFMRDIAISGNTIVAGCPGVPATFAGKAYVWD